MPPRARQLPTTGDGPTIAARLARLRTRRSAVRDNKAADRSANVAQLRARIIDLERITLDLAALLAVLIDPGPDDLTDDG